MAEVLSPLLVVGFSESGAAIQCLRVLSKLDFRYPMFSSRFQTTSEALNVVSSISNNKFWR